MSNLTVRSLEDEVIRQAQGAHREWGRSLEGEVRQILRDAARVPTPRQLRMVAEQITAMTPVPRLWDR